MLSNVSCHVECWNRPLNWLHLYIIFSLLQSALVADYMANFSPGWDFGLASEINPLKMKLAITWTKFQPGLKISAQFQKQWFWMLSLPLSSNLCFVMLVISRSTSNIPDPGATMMLVWPVRSKLRSIWCLSNTAINSNKPVQEQHF